MGTKGVGGLVPSLAMVGAMVHTRSGCNKGWQGSCTPQMGNRGSGNLPTMVAGGGVGGGGWGAWCQA